MLVSGGPNSGKSTLALALAFGFGWQVVSEDVAIIDAVSNKVINFAAPFKIKAGTRDLLCGNQISVPGFILKEWYPISGHGLGHDCDAKFALALHLAGEVSDDALSWDRHTVSEHLLDVLPQSNLLSTRGTQYFTQCLPEDACHRFSGGSLAERLSKLLELSSYCAEKGGGKQSSHHR